MYSSTRARPAAQRIEAPFGTPGQVGAQIRPGVSTGQAGEPGQVRRRGQPQRIGTGRVSGRQQLGEVRHPTNGPPGQQLPTVSNVGGSTLMDAERPAAMSGCLILQCGMA
jgi:hypothetical protein